MKSPFIAAATLRPFSNPFSHATCAQARPN